MAMTEAEALAQPAVVALVARLEARIAELEAAVAALTERLAVPAKTSANSSLPPASGFKADRAARRRAATAAGAAAPKRGPKPGHRGVSRSRVQSLAVDQVIVCRPDHCAGCGATLPTTGGRIAGRHQLIELPPVRPLVIEARRLRVRCRHCQHGTVGQYPAGFRQYGAFGPRLAASATYLHEDQHLAYARLVECYQQLFGLTISEGSLVALVGRLGTALLPAAQAIAAEVRASPVIGSDETSARIDGHSAWHWVFQTETAAVHQIAARRNGAVVCEFIGAARPAVWVSDRWKPQLAAPAARHQECLAHRLRDLQYAIDAQASPSQAAGRSWVLAMAALLRATIHLRNERDRGRLDPRSYAEAVVGAEYWLDRLLARPAATAWSADLAVSLRSERERLLVFLHDPRVPPTNNASERSLRPVVVHRKVTGGFRSEHAAHAYAAVRTVVETARKRGVAVFTALLDAATTALPAAVTTG